MTRPTPVVVRLTDAAWTDLRDLHRKDPQVVRWCLKKMLLLERSPRAGEPLLADLIGLRKLVVGDRGWRIIWRVLTDSAGAITVEVAEVWAAGARADSQVYDEMVARVAALGPSPRSRALAEVVASFGRLFTDIRPTPEPAPPEPVPGWLADRLANTLGLGDDEIASMTPDQAMARLEAYWAGNSE